MSSLFSARKNASSPLERVQTLQESFFRRLATSTASPASSSEAGMESFGKFGGGAQKGSTIGNSFVCVKDASRVCGGLIGSSGKFCVKLAGECNVIRHEKFPFDDLKEGIYIKGPGIEAYCVPCVPLTQLSGEAIESLMMESFDDATGPSQKLYSILNSGKEFLSDEDLPQQKKMSIGEALSTPVKRENNNLNLRAKFDTMLNVEHTEDASVDTTLNDVQKAKLFNEYLVELTSTVEENQRDIQVLHERMVDSTSQIGISPKVGPPNLWVGHLELKHDLEDVHNTLKRKADVSVASATTELSKKFDLLEGEHKRLRQDTEVSFRDVANELFSVANSATGGTMAVQDPSLSAKIDGMNKQIEDMQKVMLGSGVNSTGNALSIQIGNFHFHGIDDVSAWADKYLPSDYPFGAFVDAYSFLERVRSARDVSETLNALGEMYNRRKTSLSADEAIVVEAFQYPLPRGFRNSSSGSSLGTWLPGLKNKDTWENKSGTRGVKLTIRDNLVGIRTRIEVIISNRLDKYPEAAGVARVLLSDTVTFLTTLSSFISSTHHTLTVAGYPEDDAWQLVSKLIYRVFATDCYHDKRGIATEMLDSADHRSMTIGILWATFSTHHVMREYMRYSFADHPNIAGEYTRFLVANAGIAKLQKAEKMIEDLNGTIDMLIKKLDNVEKKATTASSRSDEALKLLKKVKKSDS